ncbi:MAG TPA: TlpA disulfide reductase family protein [Xanthobacteraceae bacterium]|nr:TlpA disulfide reductase family protein [Xanthobacteraceae bacterium]
MKRRAYLVVAVAVAAGAAIGLAGVYGIGGWPRNGASAAQKGCDDAVRTAERIAPLAKGELAAFAPTLEPRRAPDLAFFDAQGRATTLAGLGDGLRLVNLWATWCAPCRKEMPALDRLQATLGGKDFQVVAINVDTRDAEKPKAFLKDIGVASLAYYADPKAQSFQDLRAAGRGFGLPTTLLVDAGGCEIGFMAGPAEWSSPDALALLRAAIEPSAAD